MSKTLTLAHARAHRSRVWHSHVGKKALMAVSGLVLLAFVVVHMLANLQMFMGAARIDGYARSLRQVPLLLWPVRAVLFGAVLVHVVVAAQLTAIKRAARPVAYRRRWDPRVITAARSMLWTGVLLALFVLVHLANLTWGVLHPRFVAGDVYSNVVALFRSVPMALFYALAMSALGLHVAHGSWSLWRSLGASGPLAPPRRLARGLAVVIAGGLLSVVVAAALGLFRGGRP
jgi:succinate dehydrogenase / fumarate reductase cytochrome b subunit